MSPAIVFHGSVRWAILRVEAARLETLVLLIHWAAIVMLLEINLLQKIKSLIRKNHKFNQQKLAVLRHQ